MVATTDVSDGVTTSSTSRVPEDSDKTFERDTE